MSKIVSFLSGLILLIITFIIVVLVALVYRANERSSIKSYIFQVNNMANQRVGELQDINDISAEDLRNKLIKKYVSEYFKVIPGEQNVENRPVLKELSAIARDGTRPAYKKWQNSEAQTIAKMSAKNMFRIVHVYDDGIAALNRPADYNYSDEIAKPIYYSVRYYTETWTESNKMGTTPITEQGIIYIEAEFKPGIRKDKDVQKYLQEGKNPVELFRFEVTNIGNKE